MRVVGLYDGTRQVGFPRVVSDGVRASHMCDVYVLSDWRGRGLGVELVREAAENGPHARLAWTLATTDAMVSIGASRPRPESEDHAAPQHPGEGTQPAGVE